MIHNRHITCKTSFNSWREFYFTLTYKRPNWYLPQKDGILVTDKEYWYISYSSSSISYFGLLCV